MSRQVPTRPTMSRQISVTSVTSSVDDGESSFCSSTAAEDSDNFQVISLNIISQDCFVRLPYWRKISTLFYHISFTLISHLKVVLPYKDGG